VQEVEKSRIEVIKDLDEMVKAQPSPSYFYLTFFNRIKHPNRGISSINYYTELFESHLKIEGDLHG
jgi:hypothetical protein